jgi:hypothetical protein
MFAITGEHYVVMRLNKQIRLSPLLAGAAIAPALLFIYSGVVSGFNKGTSEFALAVALPIGFSFVAMIYILSPFGLKPELFSESMRGIIGTALLGAVMLPVIFTAYLVLVFNVNANISALTWDQWATALVSGAIYSLAITGSAHCIGRIT